MRKVTVNLSNFVNIDKSVKYIVEEVSGLLDKIARLFPKLNHWILSSNFCPAESVSYS